MPQTYVYRINQDNEIVYVSSNWFLFWKENSMGENWDSEKLLGNPIINFISGDEAKYIYQVLYNRVRAKKKSIAFPFRCDSSDKRRYCELEVVPLENDEIEHISKIKKEEVRPPVRLLDVNASRSNEMLRMCSVCKKIALSEGEWVEVEDAIIGLKLFEKEPLPEITHGLCKPCYDIMLAEFEKD